MDYLKEIHKAGVKNIEMESLSFAALTHHAGVKSAVVCVTIVDRLKGDQVGTFVIISLHYDSITIDYRQGYLPSNACEDKKLILSFKLQNHLPSFITVKICDILPQTCIMSDYTLITNLMH